MSAVIIHVSVGNKNMNCCIGYNI